MKHLVFPTTADADAFIADLKAQNVVDSVTGTTSFRRQTEVASVPAATTQQTVTETEVVAKGGGDGKEMAGGALAGGALGTAAGVAAGAVNGHGLDDDAARAVAEGGRRYEDAYTLPDDHYDRLHTAVGTDGRAVAGEDNIPADIVEATAARHNGRFV